jgi:hypothetical protein
MRHILLQSLHLGLADLLTKRLAPLQSFANGAANVPLLTIQHTKMSALPAALLGLPLTEELDSADERYDGIGGGLFFITEAYLRHPDTTPDMRTAAKQIRTELIPALDALSGTYESEAMHAKAQKAQLANLKPALDMFPVVGGTLYDWAVNFIAAGEKLDTLLSERADAKDRAEAAALRSDTLGLLNRLRKSLKTEQKLNPALPADLDAQVFGYFDLLEAKAAEAKAEAKRNAKTPKADEPKTTEP